MFKLYHFNLGTWLTLCLNCLMSCYLCTMTRIHFTLGFNQTFNKSYFDLYTYFILYETDFRYLSTVFVLYLLCIFLLRPINFC